MRAKTYDKQTGAFLAKIAECMPPLTKHEMQTWIESPKALRAKLAGALCSASLTSVAGRLVAIWRRVQLGHSAIDGAGFCSELIKQEFNVSDTAAELLRGASFSVGAMPAELRLVAVTVGELGFVGRARYEHICERGIEVGLTLCPPETGPQLRLQYVDQSKGEWVYLAMHTLSDSFGTTRGFTVAHTEDGLCLYTHGGIAGKQYDSDDLFVFISPA